MRYLRGGLVSTGMDGLAARLELGSRCCFTYIPPLAHWASSRMSRLEWMMNWFMYCAVSGKRKRAMPSPPLLEVPNAMLNMGVSVGERMVK